MNNPTQYPDIRLALREGTKDEHQSIEKVMPFFRPGFTKEEYVDLMRANRGFYLPLERKLMASEYLKSKGFDYEARMKSTMIDKDLKALNTTAGQDECTDLPELDSAEAILGCLYVLEGSTLGGQVISKQIQEKLNITPETGGAFYNSYGPQIGMQWQSFIKFLGAEVVSPEKIEPTVTAAKKTFKAMENWLARQS